MKGEGSKATLVIRVVAILIAALLSVWALVVMRRAASTLYLVSSCPPVSTTHLALIAATTESGENDTWHDGAFVVFDVMSGQKVARAGLGRWSDDSARAMCLGAARPGTLWVRRSGENALDMRDGSTGNVVASHEAIVQANPLMRVGVLNLGWDADRNVPTMMLRDGHNLILDPATLAATRYEGNVTLNPFGVRADEVVRSQSVGYYVGGLPGLVLADDRRITLDGHPRPFLVLDGQRLFGERDFYMPSLLVNPTTGRVEWPDPPSLIIVEETLVGSLTYRLTRIALDGRVIYTFDPGEALPGAWRYRPNPWTSAANGSRLIHFGGEGFIGLDTATGRELYRTTYAGEPVTR